MRTTVSTFARMLVPPGARRSRGSAEEMLRPDGLGHRSRHHGFLAHVAGGYPRHTSVVILRTALDTEMAPYKIPGACQIDPEELPHPHHRIPRDSEVIFYCAEPKEAPSARIALRAATIGFTHVHPLSGGLEG